jgi:hypothetical protein
MVKPTNRTGRLPASVLSKSSEAHVKAMGCVMGLANVLARVTCVRKKGTLPF